MPSPSSVSRLHPEAVRRSPRPDPARPNPRVGLKAGFSDAGDAVWNMTLVSNVAKPDGFFDPQPPAGLALPSRRRRRLARSESLGRAGTAAAADGLDFANSDLAFSGTTSFMGNFHGFNTYDIENARTGRSCSRRSSAPAGRATSRSTATCCSCRSSRRAAASTAARRASTAPVSAERFRGVRIFDISDIAQAEAGRRRADVPRLAYAHAGDRSERQGEPLRLRVRHRHGALGRRARGLLRCAIRARIPNTALFSIDVIQVPLAAPEKARIVNRPRIFADPTTGAIAGSGQGGDHGPGTQPTRVTNQCHDITVFPEVGLAAGACSGNGILLDISDPVQSGAARSRRRQELRRTGTRRHSTTTARRSSSPTNGAAARVRAAAPRIRRTWGADAIFDIVDRKLQFRELLQDAGGADRAGELRRAQRLDHPGAGARHHGRRAGTRAASRSSTSPIPRSRWRSPSSIAARSTPSN